MLRIQYAWPLQPLLYGTVATALGLASTIQALSATTGDAEGLIGATQGMHLGGAMRFALNSLVHAWVGGWVGNSLCERVQHVLGKRACTCACARVCVCG